MFDLNQILSAALNAAVAEAVKPLVERITALESDAFAMRDSIEKIENNPAIGVDTTLAARITALETAPNAISAAAFVTYLDQQEWFWEKLRGVADAAAEQVMEDHTSTYDHDDYDRHISDDDKHIDGDLDDAVRDAVSNLSFEVSVS